MSRYSLRLITEFYGDKKAERSGVPLIDHIHEGLAVLDHIGATEATKDAFCLHPLFQSDEDLERTSHSGLLWSKAHKGKIDLWTMLLVMEYRNQANAWLSDKVCVEHLQDGPRIVTKGKPSPGPLPEVRDMLIADKVQNRKDFIAYHYGRHERSAELNLYFHAWFEALDISLTKYQELTGAIKKARCES